jgi:hypothetical protein
MKYTYTRKQIVEMLVESITAGVGYYKINTTEFFDIKQKLLQTGSKYWTKQDKPVFSEFNGVSDKQFNILKSRQKLVCYKTTKHLDKLVVPEKLDTTMQYSGDVYRCMIKINQLLDFNKQLLISLKEK